MLEFGIGMAATTPLMGLMLWWLRHPVAKPRVFPRVLAAVVVSTALLVGGVLVGGAIGPIDGTHPGLWIPLPIIGSGAAAMGTTLAERPTGSAHRESKPHHR